MAAKPETIFYSGVYKLLRGKVFYMKNYNPLQGGIPDCWYSGSQRDLWAEFKFVKLPARATTQVKIDLSELQRLWLDSRLAEGRNVAVIVGCADGGVLMEHGAWNHTWTAQEFRDALQTKQELALWLLKFCGDDDATSTRRHRDDHSGRLQDCVSVADANRTKPR